MMRWRIVVPTAVLVLAACTSPAEENNGVARVQGTGTTSASSGDAYDGVKLAKCLRDQGIPADDPASAGEKPHRLRQVVGNLISNAVRATPPGGTITLHATGPVDAQATITVSDTGAGIAPENLPHIFDRFWRADPARGRTTGGSGLGPAIARQIVTDHGGTISATSAPGTTITVTLPTTR